MKRLTSLLIMLAIILGILPAAHAAEASERWQAAARQCEELGLEITWYPEYEGLIRRYDTDRMLLVRDGKSGLLGLDGTRYTECIFDAFGEFDGSGLAPACLDGRWGVVDLEGKTVVEFQYATQEEAAAPIAHFVSQWADGSAPYAVAGADGKVLTEYKYWQYRAFSWGLAAVTDGENWGYVDQWGREVVPCRYGEVGDFQPNGRARVYRYEGRRSNFIDRTGRELLENPSIYTSLWDGGQGLWGLAVEDGAAFYNDQGELVVQVPCAFRSSPKGQMQGNVFGATGTASFYSKEDGTWKEVAIPVGEDGLHEGLYRVQDPDSGLWGFEDGGKKMVVPALFDAVGYFDYGYASVLVDGVYGLLKNPLAQKTAEPGENKPEVSTPAFTDVPAGSWFEQGVMTCAQAGIMVGTGENTFSPNATLTDAESLMLAYRLYDQANGGDGALLKMPADYGYIKLVSDDGSVAREGYIADKSLWEMPNVYSSSGGLRLCLLGYTNGKSGGATLTFGGKEYRGSLEPMYRGSGRYEQDRFFGFEPEDPALNDLLSDAYFHTALPTQWWADLLYTIRERGWGGWDGVFSDFCQLFGNEDYRGGFADLLGSVTTLPKRFDAPPIPDGQEPGFNSMWDHTKELYEAGVIGGVDAYGTFDSDKTLTRAEAAVMIARVLDESQRLTQPHKPMPKEGEGYTLTYLTDGAFSTGYGSATYPRCVVGKVEDGSLYVPREFLLTLEGEVLPWTEDMEGMLESSQAQQSWGGLMMPADYYGARQYYRWSDGSPATEWFEFCGRIGPDGRGFVQRDGRIYRIEFDQP